MKNTALKGNHFHDNLPLKYSFDGYWAAVASLQRKFLCLPSRRVFVWSWINHGLKGSHELASSHYDFISPWNLACGSAICCPHTLASAACCLPVPLVTQLTIVFISLVKHIIILQHFSILSLVTVTVTWRVPFMLQVQFPCILAKSHTITIDHWSVRGPF